MNTANLQLKGILLAVNSLLGVLKNKGVLNQQELDDALQEAENTAAREAGARGELSRSNSEATFFPIRFLREANKNSGQVSFSSITQLVAERSNDSGELG